eukprot:6007980-Pleurochrysis_carterae.AAC.1
MRAPEGEASLVEATIKRFSDYQEVRSTWTHVYVPWSVVNVRGAAECCPESTMVAALNFLKSTTIFSSIALPCAPFSLVTLRRVFKSSFFRKSADFQISCNPGAFACL